MTAVMWVLLGFIAASVLAALGDLVSEEIRGWLDLAPKAVLRLAAARLGRDQRATIYEDEWLPELVYVLRGAESRPITRLILGTRFAIGLLMSARRIARHTSRPLFVIDGIETRTAQFRVSWPGAQVDITDEAVALAAQLGIDDADLLKLKFLDKLSPDLRAKLPVGVPIHIAHEQTLSPKFRRLTIEPRTHWMRRIR